MTLTAPRSTLYNEGTGAALLGQAASAASIPVVIASDQSAITANIGTTNGLALDATLTGGTQRTKITDGTNNAAVKAASTAPVAADPALVITISPNSPNQAVVGTGTAGTPAGGVLTVQGASGGTALPVSSTQLPAALVGARLDTNVGSWLGSTAPTVGQKTSANSVPVVVASDQSAIPITVSDTTATGTLNALNAAVTIATAGAGGAAFQLTAGTLIGTIVPEVSYDGGTTWLTGYFQDFPTKTVSSSIVFAAANALTTKTILVPDGVSNARVRVSAFTSGTAAASMRASTPDGMKAVQIYQGGLVSYLASTNGSVASGTTTGTVTSLAYLFHTAASTKRIEINKIEISSGGGSVGIGGNVLAAINVIGSFITAENGTPGGTSQTITQVDRADANADSTDVFRTGATGAPTRVTGGLFTTSFTSGNALNYTWIPSINGKPLVLRAGVAEGFEVRAVVSTTFGTANQTTVTFYWTET